MLALEASVIMPSAYELLLALRTADSRLHLPQAISLMVGVEIADRLVYGGRWTSLLDRMEHLAVVAALALVKNSQGGDTRHSRIGCRSGTRDNVIRKVPARHAVFEAVRTEVVHQAIHDFGHDTLPATVSE